MSRKNTYQTRRLNFSRHGYYQMPEKTKEEFSTDENGIRWFKTGDIGQMDNNGNLSIIGKKKKLSD